MGGEGDWGSDPPEFGGFLAVSMKCSAKVVEDCHIVPLVSFMIFDLYWYRTGVFTM